MRPSILSLHGTRRRLALRITLACSLLLGLAGQAMAQAWPQKSIRIIVPFSTGCGRWRARNNSPRYSPIRMRARATSSNPARRLLVMCPLSPAKRPATGDRRSAASGTRLVT